MGAPYDLLTTLPKKVDLVWFTQIAELLLQRTDFMVNGTAHRLREIEFYYNGDPHPDPFTHNDPVQQTQARWYFHRDEGGYRGGSFKGLDITFGADGDYCGILIRTISGPGGVFVNGCSLCVDHMLGETNQAKVADLDGDIGDRKVTDTTSPLYLREAKERYDDELYQTARVGLTLKRVRNFPTMPDYIMQRYRFLNEPQKIKKGKVHLVIALHQDGRSVDDIHTITKSPKKSIERYIEEHKTGEQVDGFKRYFYKALKNEDLCQLHGTWWKAYGATQAPRKSQPPKQPGLF